MRDYGVMTNEVERLLAILDNLSVEQIALIGMVVEDRGSCDARKFARRAAVAAGRDEAARQAAGRATEVANKYINTAPIPDWVMLQEAAADCAYAVATADLVGIAWYGQSDYDKLVAPIKMSVSEF